LSHPHLPETLFKKNIVIRQVLQLVDDAAVDCQTLEQIEG
jgi:hypothetical protein